MLKVSSSRRLLRTNWRAFLAWSSFLPAIEPERSITKTTVLGKGLASGGLTSGLASRRK